MNIEVSFLEAGMMVHDVENVCCKGYGVQGWNGPCTCCEIVRLGESCCFCGTKNLYKHRLSANLNVIRCHFGGCESLLKDQHK